MLMKTIPKNDNENLLMKRSTQMNILFDAKCIEAIEKHLEERYCILNVTMCYYNVSTKSYRRHIGFYRPVGENTFTDFEIVFEADEFEFNDEIKSADDFMKLFKTKFYKEFAKLFDV